MLRTVALLAAAALLALVAAEAALRRLDPAWRLMSPPAPLRPDLFEPHPAYGYRLHPSRTMRHRWPMAGGREVTVASNAEGFRAARDLHARDDRPRIVVLGDSMVFGPGVEAEERFTERLERRTPGWRVDNMGMVAYGPDLMLRAFEADGREPPPAVVLMMLLSADLYRVVPEAYGTGYALPRFRLTPAGDLETVPYPEVGWLRRLALVQGVRYGWFRYTRATFPLNAAILGRFAARTREAGAIPLLVFVPPLHERADDELRRRFLAAQAARHALAFLDLTAALRRGGGDRLYLAGDSHWNPDGHAVVAAALHPLLGALLAARAAEGAGSGASAP
jgi:hypothetical protein